MTGIENKPWQSLPIEERRARISAEVERMREGEGLNFLNNFFRIFVDEEEQDLLESVRIQVKKYGMSDQKISEVYIKRNIRRENAYMSEIKWNQTYREFFQTVDDAATNLNVPIQQVRSLIRQEQADRITILEMLTQSHDFTNRIALKMQINELILPVYIELRSMGYTHNDLSD
jgi:hypothetical protein